MTAVPRPVTLITGASAGIGTALARVFAERGHEVVLIARRGQQLIEIADEIERAGHKRPHVMAVDLLRADSITRIANDLHERGLEPQIVVNNAGHGLMGAAADLDRADQLAMIDLNVRALTDLSLRFIDSLARQRGGILNVASVASFLPGPGMAIYHATKAFVLSFSEALHHELKPRGVRVTVLCPGPVATEFYARAGIPEKYFPSFMTLSAERVAREGYLGLMHGKRVVVPGLENKIVTFLPRLLPRGFVLDMVRNNVRGGSKPNGES
jgi:short-subunit dehydrogenase